MALGLHFGENIGDFSVGADHERGPLDAHVLAAVHALLFPDAVGFRDGVIRICNECVRQAVLRGESGLSLARIRRDADNFRIELQKSLRRIAELAGFLGAAGGVGFGEKEEDHAFSAQFRELKPVRTDFGSAVADLKSHLPRL